jgi:hypothetical protein
VSLELAKNSSFFNAVTLPTTVTYERHAKQAMTLRPPQKQRSHDGERKFQLDQKRRYFNE